MEVAGLFVARHSPVGSMQSLLIGWGLITLPVFPHLTRIQEFSCIFCILHNRNDKKI